MDPGAPRKGHESKSLMHNLTQVNGHTVAYTCIIVSVVSFSTASNAHSGLQTCIALWGRGWTIDDGTFEYAVFYQNIVRMFESNPDPEWVANTLAWWNE
jgi:hypothetical protein